MGLKSLELNWIRKVDKSLIMPEVVFSSLDWAGGQYFRPFHGEELLIDGKHYPREHGLIEVSTIQNATDWEIAATLAHEWRHHWQACHGIEFAEAFKWPHKFDNDDYDDLIVKFFTLNTYEMDAVRFQHRYTKIHDEWEELLHDHLTC
jgi:hypothetical protein